MERVTSYTPLLYVYFKQAFFFSEESSLPDIPSSIFTPPPFPSLSQTALISFRSEISGVSLQYEEDWQMCPDILGIEIGQRQFRVELRIKVAPSPPRVNITRSMASHEGRRTRQRRWKTSDTTLYARFPRSNDASKWPCSFSRNVVSMKFSLGNTGDRSSERFRNWIDLWERLSSGDLFFERDHSLFFKCFIIYSSASFWLCDSVFLTKRSRWFRDMFSHRIEPPLGKFRNTSAESWLAQWVS